ncbi:helix-turn-helix domain-containing protein [Psychrobacter ciconiae]|uniref:helix-turn-helix domain-containing protein n=1 Tax=Psychrobacter ciconiae TaxID=1553449 RepID=UPI002948BBC3|nr:helix-turn-helix domain-containing protein [Psychrobacter ciconiae]
MTYSLDFRKQVLKSLANGMTFAEAAVFYDISPTTIQNGRSGFTAKLPAMLLHERYPMKRCAKMLRTIPTAIITNVLPA